MSYSYQVPSLAGTVVDAEVVPFESDQAIANGLRGLTGAQSRVLVGVFSLGLAAFVAFKVLSKKKA